MYNYGCENNTNVHTNAFVDLNGIPFLLAEYLDRRNFQQIDRSQIKSSIFVDQSESMRAIVDISIDDIGKRCSDGYPAILGNNTKQMNLLKMISDNCEIIDHQLNVLRRGIVITVNYQLENKRTGQVIRTMSEKFKILDRSYFLDINPRNTDDNAIIVNFSNTIVSTINDATHGRDPMIMRITNINLSYEMVKDSPKMPRVKQSLMGNSNIPQLPSNYGLENNIYRYLDMMQNRHVMPGYDPNSYIPEDPNLIMPPTWSMFNRFYRFDNNGKDIIIHGQEINDPITKVALVPCGTVHVNRTFMINPGHRIIFKFCIWKNDVTVVNDTTQVAQCLKAPILNDPGIGNHNNYHHNDYCNNHNNNYIEPNNYHQNHHDYHDHINHDPYGHHINPDYQNIIRMLSDSKNIERRQNRMINQLNNKLIELSKIVQTLVPSSPDEEPENGDTGENGDIGDVDTGDTGENGDICDTPGCDCNEIHEELEEKIEEIDNDVTNLQVAVDAIPDVVPISNEVIKEIVEQNSHEL